MKYLLNIFRFTKNLWPYFLAVAGISIIISLLNIAVPFIIKAATDLVVAAVQSGDENLSAILWIAVLLFAADFATTIFSNLGGYLGDVMSERMRKQLSVSYYQHLLKLPQKYYDNELTGKIINRLNRTITEVTHFINAFSNNFASMLLTVVFVVAVLFFYSWELGLLLVVLYPVFMWLTALTSKKWQKWMKQRNEQIDIASGRFSEVVSQIKVVKSFVQEKVELAKFDNRFIRNVKITRKQSLYWHKMDVIRRTVLNLFFFGMFAFIFVYTMQGRFTIGEMVLLIQLVNLARMPIFGMSFIIDQTQRAIAGSKDYFDVMSEKQQDNDPRGVSSLSIENATIKYDNVGFGYSDEKKVLQGISFEVQAGEKVALVGESGEGKTTITNLLLGLYSPDDGQITIDGKDIQEVTLKSLRQHIAVVFQEPALFSGTIRENIAYTDQKATNDEVKNAAKSANAIEFIDKFEKGIDTEIGERGLKLSGGQKQRIAIARAMLKNSPILVLDEATSSLDSRSEKQVQQALDKLVKNRTTLIIAHRLSTISNVDKIITLKNGKIDEIGKPSELATSGGIYSQLLELQSGAPEEAKKKLAKYDISSQ